MLCKSYIPKLHRTVNCYMGNTSVRNSIFSIPLLILLLCCYNNTTAQNIEYSSENVFIDNPDNMQLVANVAGNQHIVCFTGRERPVIFIFDKKLVFLSKVILPMKYPERPEMQIIPLPDYYYIYIHERFTQKYFLWKVEGNGKITDVTIPLQKLLLSQSHNIKLGFQLLVNGDQLCMGYHTDLTNIQKRTFVIVQTDSLLNRVWDHKVVYDFKRDEERIQAEFLMNGKHLFVLKTGNSGTSLELMKINVATGFAIRNNFSSSGYFYSEGSIHYNGEDSTVTLSALLTEPRNVSKPKYFVFLSRMNKILVEETPFTILRSQFIKNTSANFLLPEKSKWTEIVAEREPREPIRFTILDKNFAIIHDSLVSNANDAYTIHAHNFVHFHAGKKQYMLVGQQFHLRSYGLLMVEPAGKHLLFTNVRVNDRNNYLLLKARVVSQGVLIPYTHRSEAGLLRITIQ